VSEVENITGGPLLNFYTRMFVAPHPITTEFVEFVTVEHYFQCCKGLYLREVKREHDHYLTVEAIRTATRPHDAKRKGREVPLWLPLWNRAAFGHMLSGQLAKFSQHPDLARLLLETGSRKLVEHRPDKIWGDGMDGSGKNLCGRSLMLIRKMARSWNLDVSK
jgi:N-glycosidase YbiA